MDYLMTGHNIDLALAAFFIFMGFAGWRRGLIVSVFSFAGMIVGALVARSMVQKLVDANQAAPLQPVAFALIALVLIGFGSSVGSFVGSRIRRVTSWKPARFLDSVAGSGITLAFWAVMTWMAASLLLSIPVSSTTAAVGDSQIVTQLDAKMPQIVRRDVEDIRTNMLGGHFPPNLVESLLIHKVDVPDQALAKATAIQATLDSVVRVEGDALVCSTRLSGSGFVFRAGYVLTNAHVVAGVTSVGVRLKGKGALHNGKVVYWNDSKDVAVIYVPDLDTKVAVLGNELQRNDAAVVAGFPGGGPLSLVPSRVSGVVEAKGDNIYGQVTLTRRIYSLVSGIRQGDSGAPLIDANGEVSGMIFAASTTDSTVGYALTPSEYAAAIKTTSTTSVSTGSCINN